MSAPVVPVGEDFPLSPEHRQAALDGASRHVGDIDDLARRADAYFDDEYPATFLGFMRALLRETQHDDDGSYSRWDRAARAGGVLTIGKVILGR